MSVAFLQAIAAQAGFNTKQPRWDSGIDIEVGSDKALFGNYRFPNLYINFQLKATENWAIKDGSIAFRLDAATYDRLRDARRVFPIYLVLYTMPHSRAHWVVSRNDHAEMRNKAYFLSLKGAPAIRSRPDGSSRRSITVHVPTENRMTAMALLRLYKDACDDARAIGVSS